MNWANYLIQINLYFMLFYAFYIMVLRNETFFNLNRTYLLSASVFALLIPLYRTDWVQSFFITEQMQFGWANVNVMMMQGFATPITEESAWAMGDYLTLIYLVGVVLLSFHLIYRLLLVKKMIKSSNHPEAFSFFNKIIVNDNLPQKEQIEKHEQTHAKQFHSADVLFLEILCIINWFNPIMYLYKKSIRHIHEFIADEQALSNKSNKKDYAMLLFSKSFGINPNSLTNNFFNQSLLKRRIQMLQKTKSKKMAILKYGLSAPLFLIAMMLSSATISEYKNTKETVNRFESSHILNNKDSVFTNPTQLPTFPGGLKAFGEFLGKNIKYPETAKKNKIQGRVYLTFVVEKDGSLSRFKVVRGIGSGCDEEAVRVLAISPKWNPGMQNGKVVRVQYTVPIFFQLEGTSTPSRKVPPPPPAPKTGSIPPPPAAPKVNAPTLPPITIASSSNNPLYILDGIEFKGNKEELDKTIKPENIERIDVLKGEKAILKYGEKGKDGVVEITSKKKN
jgi:TonB family protein